MNENLVKQIKEYAKYQQHIHDAASKANFNQYFSELSRSENRRGMIELLIKLPQVIDLVITDCYEAKDDKLAVRMFEEALHVANSAEQNNSLEHSFNHIIDLLNKALFAISRSSKEYLKILLQRARFWYKTGNFHRCLKDLKHAVDDIVPGCSDEEMTDYNEECKIECLLLESECYKQLKHHENMKNALNKGMRCMNDFIRSKCTDDNEETFKAKKLEFFELQFQKLKDIKLKKFNECGTLSKKITMPRLFGQPNRLLKACSDAIALGQDATKGRYLYAVRNIEVGSVLIIDQPFSFSTDKDALTRNCLQCHISLKFEDSIKIPCTNCQTVSYCSEKCRKKSWDQYHKYECNIFGIFLDVDCKEQSHLCLTYRTTIVKAIKDSGELNPDFLNLHATDAKAEELLKLKPSDAYHPLNYRAVYSLKTHCADSDLQENLSRSIRSIFLAKCLAFVLEKDGNAIVDENQVILLAAGFLRHNQAINCNAYEIVENLRDSETRIWEPRNVGGAVYTTVSLSNHSCYPNVVRHSYPDGVVVRSIRFIKKGTEILDCYGPHFLVDEKQDRQKQLWNKYHFKCCCEACSNNWASNLSAEETKFKCSSCAKVYTFSDKISKCSSCGVKVDRRKVQRHLRESLKKRLTAINIMYDGNYIEALPLLLEHAKFIEKILVAPSLEMIKTQQSIIQCFNSLSCITCS